MVASAVTAIVVAAAIALAGCGDGDAYRVRAIFDNASTLVSGEEVKIAGAPVGEVEAMDVTPDNKAAVTLRIDDADFTPFKADARCTIRLQGLIGERFVECEPGSARAPELRRIAHGEGEGERLLAVERTSSPVDLDLVTDIMRRPYRERFAIVLGELGAGLAGRGEELNAVIHRANPALRQTERVLRVLARQNDVLARLARDADRALAPLAREREHVAGFVVRANETGAATAERSDDLRRGIHRLPGFLRQLKPLMADLERFARAGTPVASDLGDAAPELARLLEAQGDLADAGRRSLPSLGDALDRGRPALVGARPLIRDLGRLARGAQPVSRDLDALTASLARTGGPERLMDFLYYSALSTNGFDAIGHYLRAGLLTNTCSNFTLRLSPGCNATFFDASAAGRGEASDHGSGVRASAGPRTRHPAGEAVAGGARRPAAVQRSAGGALPSAPVLQRLLGAGETRAHARQRRANLRRLRAQAARPSPGLGPAEPMLDYLLGPQR